MTDTTKQVHWVVPSSARPPKSEWTLHAWYGLFTAAAQACPELDDACVAELIALFANAAAGLPCDKCKEHYRANFKAKPFQPEHARSQAKALQWIVDLRRTVAAQVAAAAASETDATSATALPATVCRSSRDAPRPAALMCDAHAEENAFLDAAVRQLLSKPAKKCDCNMRAGVLDLHPATPARRSKRRVVL